MGVVTSEEFAVINTRLEKYEAALKTLYPNTNAFTPDMIERIVEHADIERAPDNTERSAIEKYKFYHNPPENYFLYINQKNKTATTWTGEVLGTVYPRW
jgi:hypothetical protein